MTEKIIGYDVVEFLSKSLALRFKLNNKEFTHVVGVARGGMIPATMISYVLGTKLLTYGVRSYGADKKQSSISIEQDLDFESLDSSCRLLIVDDICDTGNTFDHIKERLGDRFDTVRYASLFAKKSAQKKVDHFSVLVENNTWVVFPWEK